jgi:SAM-dependent methyltransferase
MQLCYGCSNTNLLQQKYINTHFHFLKEEKRDIFQRLQILSCPECGFSYAFPFIPSSVLQQFYENDYASQGGPHFNPTRVNTHLWKNNISPRFASQLILAFQYLKPENIKHFLDIGANEGESFLTFRKLGMSLKCYALEQGEEYQRILLDLGVQVLKAKDEFLALETKFHHKFDLITMSHVLEHFNAEQLHPILQNVRNYLKPGGVFICEVPHDDNWSTLLEQNQAPHLCFFSRDSLERIFLDSGFNILFSSAVGEKLSSIQQFDESKTKVSLFKESIKKRIAYYPFLNSLFKLRIYRYYPYLWIKAKWQYLHQNHFRELLTSADFQYRANGNCLRICATISDGNSNPPFNFSKNNSNKT